MFSSETPRTSLWLLRPSSQKKSPSFKTVSGTLVFNWTNQMQGGGARFLYCLKPAKRPDASAHAQMLPLLARYLERFAHVRERVVDVCPKAFPYHPGGESTPGFGVCPACVVLRQQSPLRTWTARASRRASGWCRRLTCGRAVRPAARTSTSYGCFWRRYRAFGSLPSCRAPQAPAPPSAPVSSRTCITCSCLLVEPCPQSLSQLGMPYAGLRRSAPSQPRQCWQNPRECY